MLDLNLFQIGSNEEKPDAIEQISEVSLHDIAIIGISIQLPMAENKEQFWKNLRNGVDAVSSFPDSRRKVIETYVKRLGLSPEAVTYFDGAYLEEIDKFDYRFFRMSPREASLMNPSQRIFLQTAWQTIEDAGYGGGKLAGEKTGVYVGYCADAMHDYKRLIAEEDPSSIPIAIPGNLTSIIASRISYLLDMKGPAIAVDTACSSSLVALHLACQGIRNGDCEMALAGSVKTLLLPADTGIRVGIESSDGRARTFDDASDGTGMGEGTVAVMLKPLAKALADGDSVYAVIKGTAVNQDGTSVGITAPNVAAQEDVIVKAWLDAGIDPMTISYIEAHGTGTKLGDPIEIEGISRAFRRFTDKRQFCAVGSVKTNLGHLDNAAGLAGLVKAILALKHKELPPSLHFNRPNHNINFIDSPIYVNDRLTPWETEGYPRRCGVSAFGLSGTNCHVVLEEAPENDGNDGNDGNELNENNEPHLFTLSAKSETALKQLIINYADYLSVSGNCKRELANLCYTANTGRGHYEYRVVTLVNRWDELAQIMNEAVKLPLEQLTETGLLYSHARSVPGTDSRQTPQHVPSYLEVKDIMECITGRRRDIFSESTLNDDNQEISHMRQLCELYILGAEIPWERLYKQQRYKRLNLPSYTFDRHRCWVDGSSTRKGTSSMAIDLLRLLEAGNRPEDLAAATEEAIHNWQMKQATIYLEDFSEEHRNFSLQGKETAASNDIETIITEAWVEVLGMRPDLHDNFFDLGGNSLSAVQLINKLHMQFGVDLPFSELFQSPTVFLLSEEIRRAAMNEVDVIPRCDERKWYPVSSAQKRLFLLNELHGDNTGYNMPGIMEIEGVVDIERFRHAIHTIVERHESLRTTFGWEDGQIVQYIHQSVESVLEFIDANQDEIDSLVNEFIRPFPLNRQQLLRIGLVRLEPERHLLLFDMHHIISDGVSVSKLVLEFARLYKGESLPPLPIQYKDYAVWQLQQLKSEHFHKHELYWKQVFTTPTTTLRLPVDHRLMGGTSTLEGRTVLFRADEGLSKKLLELAASTSTTLYIVILAAYNILLSRYTGQEDIVVGSPVAGRTRTELEPLIGMFVNTLAIRNYPARNKTFLQFLFEVKEHVVKALEHQEYPFEWLVQELDITVEPGKSPLFDTMFVYQNTDPLEFDFGEAVLRHYPYDFGISKFDLTLQSWDNGPILTFALEYRIALFKHETMVQFTEQFLRLLEQMTIGAEFTLNEVDLVSQDERLRIEERIRRGKETIFEEFDF